jgi:methionine aminopeptidase
MLTTIVDTATLCNLFPIFSDLGAHVDGFIAAVAHTVVVGSSKIIGRQADALLAAHYASEAALRLMKPGTEVLL